MAGWPNHIRNATGEHPAPMPSRMAELWVGVNDRREKLKPMHTHETWRNIQDCGKGRNECRVSKSHVHRDSEIPPNEHNDKATGQPDISQESDSNWGQTSGNTGL